MESTPYAARRERLRRLLREKGLSSFLVSDDASRFYLSGFELHDAQLNESSGRLVITAEGRDFLFTDARYTDAARRLWDEDDIVIYRGDGAADMGRFLKDTAGGSMAFNPGSVTVAWWHAFTDAYGGNCVDTGNLVDGLRVIKDTDEIARMKASCALNEQLMRCLPGIVESMQPLTEARLAWIIEKYFRENGATEQAFPGIVAYGPNGALPHAIPGETVIREGGPLLVDIGCRLQDYCSDQTRVFWIGSDPEPAYLRTLDLVQEAQRRAIAAIRPGVVCRDVARIAENWFESQHCAEHFTHGLGHGVGLETHERPSLNMRSETVLRPGMVVTVEPGLYYPEWGGVRWEHMVHVTEDGCEIL